MVLSSISWQKVLSEEFSKKYYTDLVLKINKEYSEGTIYPPLEDIFKAFNSVEYDDVKVVIIGQDPYHEESQAMGLAFSVNQGVKIPPSLQNIYKELEEDVGATSPGHGNLTKWTKEGVLLLNSVLTVRAHEANSHKGIGWEYFTDAAIKAINASTRPTVFMLWGTHAIKKSELITNDSHLVLKAPHPSPLSAYRGFFGCKHFSKANEFLASNNREPVNWQL